MGEDTYGVFHRERSTLIYSKSVDDSVDEYLDDPNLSIVDMIQIYDVSTMNAENAKEKRNLRCVICGGRAFGHNFDQISCESCKAFFRRNALRDINELHCRFAGNCNITVETRRHCSYCRIKKCFALGMRKESIRTEEEKVLKRLQLDKTRRRKCRPLTMTEVPKLMTPGNTNILVALNPADRIRINNIIHCYDQYTATSCMRGQCQFPKPLFLRIDEFFNRKKQSFINLISYFKHLPELQNINLDDQVALIKQNIRIIMPLNYAILRGRVGSKCRNRQIQTIGCYNGINIHAMLRELSSCFIDFVAYDHVIVKLFLIILFFTTNSLTTTSIYDPGQYRELNIIRQIQASYTELLWSYLIEKWGKKDAVRIFTKLITKYLHVQTIMDQVDMIVRMNDDTKNIDELMQSFLQLT